MRTHGPLGLVLLLSSALAAQTVPPALMVDQGGGSVPLGLAKVQTEVRIFGSVAETATTMTFTNPMPRVMEGNLYFPLPEGATISGYALDINGVMVEGVAVEKHEARRVFEDVVRRGIDPGLVEWTKGNNFQTRVFPIPARGSRTIRVQYVTELLGGKDAPAYHLPLKFKDKLSEFSLRVEVVKPVAPPKVTKGELANFSFEKWRESYVAETKQKDIAPVEDLVIALRKTDQPQVVVEKADDGQVYFAIHDDPPAPAAQLPVAAARHVVLFWDASGSRAGDHKREIVVLERYLSRLLPDQRKIVIDLVLVRNTASKPVRVEFSKAPDVGRIGNPSYTPSALAAELQKVQYDGGTQLGAIGPLPGAEKPDLYLLFTDGISNFGRDEPRRLDAPLVIFSAATSANHAFLYSLAMANGGRYFNLANWKDADVLEQAGRAAWSFLSASIDEGHTESRSHAPRGNARSAAPRREHAGTQSVPARVPTQSVGTSLYPQQPQPLAGRFTLAGKLKGDAATVTVNYGIPGRTPEKRSFRVSRADAAEGSLLRRLWGQKKLAELMIFQKRNEKEIAALGKQFGMVTPYTSLLVLDTVEQYVQYEIAPPKSLGAMREEYLRRIDTLEHQKQKRKSDKLAAVVRMWEERVKWWNTEFKYPKDFKYAQNKRKIEAGGGAPSNRLAGPDSRGGVPPAPARAMNGREKAEAKSPAPSAGRVAPEKVPVAPTMQPPPVELPLLEAPSMSLEAPSFGGRSLSEVLRNVPGPTSASSGETAAKTKTGIQPMTRQPGIVIKEWTPDTPYLKELRAAKRKSDLFDVYMKNRVQFGNSPAFFLDCADFFREANQLDVALQVLSNIAELELEDAGLLRVLGYRLLQIGQLDLAVQTFERVLELRPEEPQSYRDLALTLARRAAVPTALTPGPSPVQRERGGKDGPRTPDAVREDYRRAIDLFVRIVLTHWDERFPEIEVIALEEVNQIIPKAKAAGVSDVPLDPRLIKLLDVDVRIVMTWQADNTDIDLWVTEPSGEKAFYSHNRTTIGGLVSRDFTGGYGPEEYLVRRAAHGTYKIEANYYGSRATRLLGAVAVQADVFTNYGRPNEQCKSLTLRLKEAKDTVPIGEIEF